MKSQGRPVLFLTIPNTSLMMKKGKDGLGLSMGASFVAGAIEESGLEVDFIDLNLALNSFRKSDYTGREVLSHLSSPRLFLQSYAHDTFPSEIETYLEFALSQIPRREYSSISFSLDRRDYYSFANKVTYCFSLLLAKRLKSVFHCPIFMGGSRVLSSLGKDYLNEFSGIQPFPIDKTSHVSSMRSFGAFLKEVSEGLPVHGALADEIFHKKDGIASANGLIPKYDIRNFSDLVASPREYFPVEILRKYPALEEIEPIFIAPYKFSVGCPYTCAFCSDGKDMYFRQLRPDDVGGVLGELTRRGIRNFSFYNNNINLNQFFLDELEKSFIRNNVSIQFSDSANLQKAGSGMFQQLRRMGCIKLWFGTETLSTRLLKIIDKNLDYEKIISGLDASHENDIWNCCNFIHTFPHETEEEFQHLLHFIRTSDKFDTYSINQFRLLTRSAYFADPAGFGIRIREVSKNGIVATYDQIGGAGWEENVEIGKKRQSLAMFAKRPISTVLASNDFLLFGMKSIGMKRSEINSVLFDFTEFLSSNDLLVDYDHKHTYTIPSEKFDRDLKPTAFGQDMARLADITAAPF